MTWRDALTLGRVSNLPTVWTNVAAGAVLGGGAAPAWLLGGLAAAMSLLYVAGMYLNDAFDRGGDAAHRPDRPIPSGRVAAGVVFALGFGLLGAGLVALWLLGRAAGNPAETLDAGLALAAAIVLYDVWHEGNPISPVLMGVCRTLVYDQVPIVNVSRTLPAGVLLHIFSCPP